MNKNNISLIDKSEKILAKQNIEQVWNAGLTRDPNKYHITVMYPPLKVMDTMDETPIYKDVSNKNTEFSLYIHIPFCSGSCLFCYFYFLEKAEDDVITAYLKALKKEMAMVKEKVTKELGHFRVNSIFYGGGSPTELSVAQFQDLSTFVIDTFDIIEGSEITLEVHPEILRRDARSLLQCYLDNGVNRLNIGTQSYNDHLLKITNRRHTAQEAIDCFKLARDVGFENLNIDLLYPLPDLTPEIWEHSINQAFELQPESVTSYFMAAKEVTPIHKFIKNFPNRFPDERSNHLFRIMIIEKAKEVGYSSDDLIDWFVKPKNGVHYEHQKFEARRTEDVQLMSFGTGVFTYFNHYQYYNYADIEKYCESIKNDKLPIWKGVHLNKKERMARAMVMGIKSGVVSLKDFKRDFNEDALAVYEELLTFFQTIKLIHIENEAIKLTTKGVLFADEIAIQFASDEVKAKLDEKQYLHDGEKDKINNFNFMGDIEPLKFVTT